MTAISSLVRKLKKVVTGVEAPVTGEQPFRWEPAPVGPLPGQQAPERAAPAPVPEVPPLELPAAQPAPPPAQAPALAETPSSPPPSWRRPQLEFSSVVGAEIPAEVSDFGTVYQGAGVRPPAHGYGIERVAQMLEHPALSGLETSVKASAVLAALDAAGVHVHDVIHDGLLRYKALVAFEAAKELELHAVRPRNEYRVEELRLAIAEFQQKKNAELDALTHEATAAVAALNRLKSRQRAEEERFHRALSMFVEPLPARVIPMTPKAEASSLDPVPAKPELKLVFATPPATADPTPSPERASEATPVPGWAGEGPPPALEPEAADAPAVRLPRKEATIRLTREQAHAILAGFRESEGESSGVSETVVPEAAGAQLAFAEPEPRKDATIRLTAAQTAAIVAGFRETEAEASPEGALLEQASAEGAPLDAAPGAAGLEAALQGESGQDRKDATLRLTPEQAAAIVAGFAEEGDAAAAASGGPAGDAAAADGVLEKQATLRLTAEQAAAILASFANAGAEADGEGGQDGIAARDGGEVRS